ncbi:MAG: hypothetical protein JOY64_36175 [Alphaproteobacteria bacterium]|nr:hypothetical protein [Alphaproteobacteria bacterium]MBV8413108.1 hypothetical protein [Alphaproteobacteria bacterium]
MPEIVWSRLADPLVIEGTDTELKPIKEPWRVLARVIRDCTYMRLVVDDDGAWRIPGVDTNCGPDGYAGIEIGGKTVIDDCAIGALIGRFGGGSAGYSTQAATDADKGRPFPIGTYCIMPIPAKSVGPLFVGFNVVARPIQVRRLKITIEGATPTL